MRSVRKTAAGIVLAILAIAAPGCGGPKDFTPEDFARIKPEMTEDQVREILGGPSHSKSAGKGGGKSLWYAVGNNYYVVYVMDGKVAKANPCRSKNEYDALRSMYGSAGR